jgi:D-alanyl-D-alanine dipeptidase
MKFKFVDLGAQGFVIEPRYWFFGWTKSKRIVGRPSLVKALVQARSFLPRGWNFKIWDCQRPRFVQIAMLQSFLKRLRAAHPDWPRQKLIETLFTFGARPILKVTRLDTHRNGGAVDLTLIDARGRELYLGTDHDDLTEAAALDYYETKKKLTPRELEARDNRRRLKKAMLRAGFEGLVAEWWHWSLDK